MLNICLALLPVLLLLCGLLLMDSFKLLRPSSLAMALAWGAAVALMNQPLHEWLLSDVGIDLRTLTRYAAPVTEEIAQGRADRRAAGPPADRLPDRRGGAGLCRRHRLCGRRELRLPAGHARLADDVVAGARAGHGDAARRDHGHRGRRGQELPGTAQAAPAGGRGGRRRDGHRHSFGLQPPAAAAAGRHHRLAHRAAAAAAGGVRPRRESRRRMGGRRARPRSRAPGIAHLAAVPVHQLRHLSAGAEVALRRPGRGRHGVPAAAAAGAVGAGARAADGAPGRPGPAGGRRPGRHPGRDEVPPRLDRHDGPAGAEAACR